MRIHLLTVGSRGDVGPMLALSQGLIRAGHQLKLVSSTDHKEAALALGVPFGELDFSVSEILKSNLGQQMLTGKSAHHSRASLGKAVVERLSDVSLQIIEHCQDAEFILSNETLHLVGHSIAEAKRIPHLALCLIPWGRTSQYPSIYADHPLHKFLPNVIGHDLVQRYSIKRLLPSVNEIRAKILNLPGLTVKGAMKNRQETATLLGYSASVVAPPSDWPGHQHVTGYWFLESPDYSPAPDLAAFLSSHTPPIYIGFGSMIHDPRPLLRIIDNIARRTKRRFLFLTGWSDASLAQSIELSENVKLIQDIPHSWLLPRVSAVLHHGGAGTTAAGLWAGLPTMIAPFIVDQFFWARRVTQLGVGLDLGIFWDLNETKLKLAFDKIHTDYSIRNEAYLLGQKIKIEQGVEQAVRVLSLYTR